MGTVVPLVVLLIGVVIVLGHHARGAEPTKRQMVIVFAAASLFESFEELRTEFRRQNPDVEILLVFGGSHELRKRIERGERVDVFASADQRHMDELIDKGLVVHASVFAHNELVIVVPKGNPAKIRSLGDLRNAKHIAMGREAGAVGRYTLEMLTRANRDFGPDFKAQVLDQITARESNVRDVLAKVVAGEAFAGIVYRTDAMAMAGQVEAIEIPPADNVIATYPIAVLAKSGSPDAAAKFVQFVRSSAGQKILAENGFQPGEDVLPPPGSKSLTRRPLRPVGAQSRW